MSKGTTITAAACLLLGAGAVVVWKQYDQEAPQTNTPATSLTAPQRKSTTSREQNSNKPEKIKWALVTDATLATETRLNLVRQIDKDINPSDIDLLFESLRHQSDPQNSEDWWVVMNEIIEQMRRKGVAPQRLGGELIAIVEDPKMSEVSRDYAVQHLSLWVAPPSKAVPAEPSEETRAKALETIAITITDPAIAHTSIPGTALMSLTAAASHLPPETMAQVWGRLDPALTSMLNGETSVPLSTKTTIIQSVAMRGSDAHLPLVQTMARDEKIDPSMRLSSIAALGIYASEDDREYLTSISQGKTRYRYAAQSALKKLSK